MRQKNNQINRWRKFSAQISLIFQVLATVSCYDSREFRKHIDPQISMAPVHLVSKVTSRQPGSFYRVNALKCS